MNQREAGLTTEYPYFNQLHRLIYIQECNRILIVGLYNTKRSVCIKEITMLSDIAEEIIEKALVTYIAKGTCYLTRAQIFKTDNIVKLSADFSIKESCYLSPGSGHFNAVEALMCFNQMIYVALLGGIDKKMFSFYNHITPDDFNNHRRKVYILEFEKLKFKKQIDNTSFHGKLEIKPIHKVGDKIYVDCCLGFGNDIECKNFIGNIKVFIPVL